MMPTWPPLTVPPPVVATDGMAKAHNLRYEAMAFAPKGYDPITTPWL